jgi:hypothetical protein
MTVRARRAIFVVAALLLVGIPATFAIRALWHTSSEHMSQTGCTLGGYDLDTSQSSVAATMVGVVTNLDLPERADVLVLAAALQESKLTNLSSGDGDRDSVGVLQQRPSQGWGTVAQLNDVHYATRAFLQALVKLHNWQHLPLSTAIQKVQVSADGSLYAVHEPEAQSLADVLTGRKPAAITCSFGKPTVVASTTKVASLLTKDLPVNPPATTTTTVRVPGAAWQTAAWFVANADRLGIDEVSYDNRQWTRTKGWKTATASTSAVLATMHR